MGKIIFLDVDGTLVDFDVKMPDSTRIALKDAKENGHKIVICTGRSKFQIYPWLLDIGFNGIIGAAGAYVEYDGQIIFHNTLRSDKLRELIALFDELGLTYLLQSNHCVYIDNASYRGTIDYFKRRYLYDENVINPLFEDITLFENFDEVKDVETLVLFNDKIPLSKLREIVDDYFAITPSSIEVLDDYSAEITCNGINKAIGAKKMLDFLGLDRSDCIAFGDGPNDIELLEFASVGVAMGNGFEEAKKVADIVTDPIWEDGLYNGFKKIGLI